MHKNLPSIAKRWEREYSSKDILPKRVTTITNRKSNNFFVSLDIWYVFKFI